MIYAIIWSDRAEKNYDDILEYLVESWGRKVLIRFIKQVNSTFDLIEHSPRAYPKYEDHENIRKAVINPHISLFYRIKDEKIELICFWNNRRNPDDLPI